MPTTRFDTTTKALKDIGSLKPEDAVKNIEGWETYLKTHDHEGVKKIVADLEKLKHMLSSGKLDDAKIRTLMHTLGKETTAAAAGSNEAHIKQLGEALTSAL